MVSCPCTCDPVPVSHPEPTGGDVATHSDLNFVEQVLSLHGDSSGDDLGVGRGKIPHGHRSMGVPLLSEVVLSPSTPYFLG